VSPIANRIQASLRPFGGVAIIFGFLIAPTAFSADTEDRLKQLEQQNQALQQKLSQQQTLIDDLARKLSKVEDKKSEPAAEGDDSAAKRGYSLGQVRLSGEGGMGIFHTSNLGRYNHADFRVDEAKLFVEAPLWENYVFAFAELDLVTRERQVLPAPSDENFHLGEIYVDFEGVSRLWNRPGMLGLRVGRIDLPFGEEYISRDAIDNPLISHSLTDIWGIDEGVELYGAMGQVDYVFAVQNGGHPALADFNRDKALTGRLGLRPNKWLRVSGSAMRTGALDVVNDKMSELWFGNGFVRNIGFTATTFSANVYEGDVQVTWKSGHVKAAGGLVQARDNSPAAAKTDRDVYYYYVEALQRLPQIPKLYAAARVSQLFADKGFPVVGNGQFGSYFYTPSLMTDRMLRISVGPGYQFSEHLAVKLEYTLDRRHVIAPRSEDTHLFAAEVTFGF
jgi:hypothetical protein